MKLTFRDSSQARVEALDVVADEEAPRDLARLRRADDRQDVDDRQVLGEVVGGVVEHLADRAYRPGP